IRSSSRRFSSTTGSAARAASCPCSASRAGTLAEGSSRLNCAITPSAIRPTSAAPGTRPHVESTPSRMSPVAGSPASSLNDSKRGPLPMIAAAKFPRPCVLCMDRLCAAIEPNDSPVTGDGLAAASAGPAVVPEDPPGLPGGQRPELVGERLGIAGEPEGLEGEGRRGRVVAVRCAGLGREPRDEHIRPENADDAHDVRKHLLVVPLCEGLAVVLREAEILRAGEELPSAVSPAGGEQLLGADDPQFVAEFWAERVLAAVAARHREIRGAVAAAARQVGDELRVLVVGMRRNVEDAPQLAKAAQLLQDGLRGLGRGGNRREHAGANSGRERTV